MSYKSFQQVLITMKTDESDVHDIDFSFIDDVDIIGIYAKEFKLKYDIYKSFRKHNEKLCNKMCDCIKKEYKHFITSYEKVYNLHIDSKITKKHNECITKIKTIEDTNNYLTFEEFIKSFLYIEEDGYEFFFLFMKFNDSIDENIKKFIINCNNKISKKDGVILYKHVEYSNMLDLYFVPHITTKINFFVDFFKKMRNYKYDNK